MQMPIELRLMRVLMLAFWSVIGSGCEFGDGRDVLNCSGSEVTSAGVAFGTVGDRTVGGVEIKVQTNTSLGWGDDAQVINVANATFVSLTFLNSRSSLLVQLRDVPVSECGDGGVPPFDAALDAGSGVGRSVGFSLVGALAFGNSNLCPVKRNYSFVLCPGQGSSR